MPLYNPASPRPDSVAIITSSFILFSFHPSFLPCFLPSILPPLLRSFLRFFRPSVLPSFLPSILTFFLRSLFVPSFVPYVIPSFLPSFYPSIVPLFLHIPLIFNLAPIHSFFRSFVSYWPNIIVSACSSLAGLRGSLEDEEGLDLDKSVGRPK